MANQGESVGRARKTEFLAALLDLAPDEQVFEAKPEPELPKIERAPELLREPEVQSEPEPAPVPQPPTRSHGWASAPAAPVTEPQPDSFLEDAPHPAHFAPEPEPEPAPAPPVAAEQDWAPAEPLDDFSDQIEEAALPEEPQLEPLPAAAPPKISESPEDDWLNTEPSLNAAGETDAWSEPPAPAPRSAAWFDAVAAPEPEPDTKPESTDDSSAKPAGKLDWLKGIGKKIGLGKAAPQAAASAGSEQEPEMETWTLESPEAASPNAPEPEQWPAPDSVESPSAPEPVGFATEPFEDEAAAPIEADASAAPPAIFEAPAQLVAAHEPEAPAAFEEAYAAPEPPVVEAPAAAPSFNWMKAMGDKAEAPAPVEPEMASEPVVPSAMSLAPAEPEPGPELWAAEEKEPEVLEAPIEVSLDHNPSEPEEFEEPPAAEAPKFDWSKVTAAQEPPAWSAAPLSDEFDDEQKELDEPAAAPAPATLYTRSEPEPEPIHMASMAWEEPESEPEPAMEPEAEMSEPPRLRLEDSQALPPADAQPEPAVPEVFGLAEAPSLEVDPAGAGKSYRWKRLGDLLVDLGVITPEELTEALQLQKVGKKPLGQTLVENGFITEALLLKTLAAQYDVELWDLEAAEPSAVVARMLPEALCRERSMIAVARREDGIVVAMKNPADLEGLEEVQRITGMEAIPALASAERIDSAISEIFNPIAQMKAMQEKSGVEVADDQEFDVQVEPDGSVVQMVDELLEMAIKMKVSDVHIEPREKMVEVRVRLDGQLIKIKEYSKAIAPMLTARFKILAEVDLVEWRIPQDGRISIKCDGRVVDMRVSILPSLYGQRIVMRLLDKSNALRKLDELGFSQHNLVLFRKLINRPYGLFLVTGPTGSGKTTTLYAALNEIRKPTNNVMTCEDPVEYDIHGINQSQVNEKVGLTFGSQLRAILRQDPDIVLVGEIRDRETAEIAIKASMTGHMVLSTLHTNDAPGALPRLLDMGVDASNLSTALVGAMGQRLIRRLCPHCREDSAPTPDEIELLENSFGSSDLAKLWRPVGCPKCHGQGYKGRMAIHEIMPVTSESAELVQQRAPIERIREVVRYYGYRTMQEDSLDRIISGVTSLDEAKRILSFDDVPRLENPEAYYKKLQKSA